MENYYAISAISEIFKPLKNSNNGTKLILNEQNQISISKNSKFILNQLKIQNPIAILYVDSCTSLKHGKISSILLSSEMIKIGCQKIQNGDSLNYILSELQKFETFSIEKIEKLKFETKTPIEDALNISISKLKSQKSFFKKLLSSLIEKEKNLKKIRIISIGGNSLLSSFWKRGILIKGYYQEKFEFKKKSKILCLDGSIEREKSINKIKLTFETTNQLENWKTEEEQIIRTQILNLKKNGIELIITTGKISDLGYQYLNEMNIKSISLVPIFDVKKICELSSCRLNFDLFTIKDINIGTIESMSMINSNFLFETIKDFYSLVIYAPSNEQADEYGNQIYNIFSKIDILKNQPFLINNHEYHQQIKKELNIFSSIFSEINKENQNEIFEIKKKYLQNSFETTRLILKSD
eukprot:gene3390-5935_t